MSRVGPDFGCGIVRRTVSPSATFSRGSLATVGPGSVTHRHDFSLPFAFADSKFQPRYIYFGSDWPTSGRYDGGVCYRLVEIGLCESALIEN